MVHSNGSCRLLCHSPNLSPEVTVIRDRGANSDRSNRIVNPIALPETETTVSGSSFHNRYNRPGLHPDLLSLLV